MPSKQLLMRRARTLVDSCRHVVGWYESEDKIARDAQKYWEAPPPEKRDYFSHWRSGFDDADTWHAVGHESFQLYETFAKTVGFDQPVKRVVEWGSGGGANAVHFGKIADEFYGVDVNEPSLEECGKQMRAAGLDNFRPVLINATAPEAALEKIPHDCDLFVCLYVFELFPTPEYGVKILKIAHQMLRSGGMAMIHIKYPTGLATRSRRWGYRFGVSSMTTYQLHDFWEIAKECGFQPHAVSLVPKQPLVQDERYAYFILTKR